MKPRVAKGTRDFSAQEVAKRQYVMHVLRTTFEVFGYSPMSPSVLKIEVALGRGPAEAVLWTTDLSYDYVKINAEYRT